MSTIILRYAWLISSFLMIIRGSPLFIDAPPTLQTEDSIRQSKADEILQYMNEFIDPCEDFYEFSCGNYAAFNPATPVLPSTGFFQMLQFELERKIKSLLATDDVADSAVDRKVKSFYRSCMNLPALHSLYAHKLRQIIGEFGQMPALEGNLWPEDDFDWVQTVGEIAFKYDLKILMDFDVAIDFANNSMNRLYVSEQDFGLSKSLYVEGENSEELATLAISANAAHLGIFLGLPMEVAIQTARDNIQLERSLVKATVNQQAGLQLKDLYTAVNTIEELHQKYAGDLDMKQLIGTSMGALPNLKVYIDNGYMQHMIEVLKATPKRIVANYIFFKLMMAFIVTLPPDPTKLSDVCVAHMKTNFYKNLDNMVYRHYNTKATEQGVHHMWTDIKSIFQTALDSPKLNWIEEGTRKYAKEKLQAMKLDIVSYEETNFAQQLAQLQLNDLDYVENLKAVLSSKAVQRRTINYAIPQNFESGAQLSTSPGYIIVENTVKVPVALLQPYYAWSASLPNAFNFGILGFLLSHELIHGYDGGGRLFDAQGNNREWWDKKSAIDFNHRSQCFIDQYKQYVFGGQMLPEMPNQNENIADNGGIRLAYTAYLKWYDMAMANRENLDWEILRGLNYKYNHKQLFFISYSHLWCSDVHANYVTTVLKSDEHVPSKFRVIGPLSNFDEFSKEFKCPKGSGMNPLKKCEIY